MCASGWSWGLGRNLSTATGPLWTLGMIQNRHSLINKLLLLYDKSSRQLDWLVHNLPSQLEAWFGLIWLGLPKMVFGHNLHHIAPFLFLEAGFCMVFRRAFLLLFVPGTNFWTQDPIFCLESQIWLRTRPGRCFQQIRGPEKHGFTWEWFTNLQI